MSDDSDIAAPAPSPGLEDDVEVPEVGVAPQEDAITPPDAAVTPPDDDVTPPAADDAPPDDDVTPPKADDAPPEDDVTPPEEAIVAPEDDADAPLEDDVEVPADDVELPAEEQTPRSRSRKVSKGGGEGGEGKRKKRRLKRQEGEEVEEAEVGVGEVPESREDDVAPAADSEDDQEGPVTGEDVAFIDDEGVAPDNQYASDNEGSIGDAPQAEEGEVEEEESDIDSFFKKKRRKKAEVSQEVLDMFFERQVAGFMRASVQDAVLNRQKQPATKKLMMLPQLKRQLLTTHLRQGFLERGILGVLKQWLEPMPDQSLPSLPIRTGILDILGKLQLDVGQTDEREQLVESSIGKIVMFLSLSPEEIRSNRKMAKALVDTWSRPLFQKSTRYEDLRDQGKDLLPPPPKKGNAANSEAGPSEESREDDLDLEAGSTGPKPGDRGYRVHALIPRPMVMDFKHRPKSKLTAEMAQQRRPAKEGRRYEMMKKIQKIGGKSKNLRAEKLSVEGRNLTKYI